MEHIEILIVEDNPAERKLLRVLLESEGHRVAAVGDIPMAIRILKLNPPDLLVTDYLLDERTGLQLLHEVRQIKGCEQLPVVALSGLADFLRRLATDEVQFDDILSKPIDPEVLIGTVRQFVPNPSHANQN